MGCVGLGTHGSQRDLSALGVLGEEGREGFSGDCVVVIGPLPQVRSQSTQTRARATTKKKKEKEKGQRLSTGNAVKSSVQCETLSRLRRPFVGEEPFHHCFEPDD